MFRSFIKRFKERLPDGPIFAILMISLTALLTHGLLIPRLGYYYDDWYMLWSGASRGAQSLIPLFSMDRPLMGVLYSLFYRIIGENILGWHLFTLLFRVASGIAFYWILNLSWPKLKSLFVLSAMIFVVFPGFLAEPNAATKINHLIGYSAALFSIAFTLQSVKTDRRDLKYGCLALSLLLMALYMWIYEYMIGLEVMRLVLLYWIHWQDHREKAPVVVKKVLRTYLPYILVVGIFMVWRVFIFDSSRSATDLRGLVVTYYFDLLNMVLRLVFQVIKDFFSATLFAWFVQPFHLFTNADYWEIAAALFIAVIVVVLAAGTIYTVRGSKNNDPENESPILLVLIGGLIALGAVFPVVLSNRYLNLMDPYKSYALHPSAGALIIAIGFLLMLQPKFRKAALVIMLGLAVMTQSLNGQEWAKYWDVQKNFWWQLTWRAPNIRDNTLVIAHLPEGFAFHEGYEMWGPLNLIYRSGPARYPLIQAEILNQQTIGNVVYGPFVELQDRDIYVPRYYSNTLIISQPTIGACVHVIDGALPVYSANERPIVEKAGPYSNIDLIDPSGVPPVPRASIFGQEPEHGWCYHYQQASLARQIGDWSQVGAQYDALTAAGLKATDPSEYFVFIEGLVNLGRVEEARTIVENEYTGKPELKYSLCKSLSAAAEYPIAYGYQKDQIGEIICE